MEHFFNNILEHGSIIASPSKDPDYNFHWVRDAAIVMKGIITLYNDDNENQKYIKIMKKYIDTEIIHIQHHAAEPKFNIDKTPYKGEWGRPQNDGPALRGIVCLQMLQYFDNEYIHNEYLEKLHKIIQNDLKYTIENIDNPCFDLWEEQYGFHLYTRLVQYKFLLDGKRQNINAFLLSDDNLIHMKELLNHHIDGENIFSSFTTDGKILRVYDSSLLLGLNHVDYDKEIFCFFKNGIQKYVLNMIDSFTHLYEINSKCNIPFLGRYYDDAYFQGNPWIICTLALFHYFIKTEQLENYKEQYINFIDFLSKNKKMDLPEQIHKTNGCNLSVERLTWNYSEFIFLLHHIKNYKISGLFNLI
jgi:glucoamylase